MARAYYNEIDPAAAHILRAMIDADVIAPGDVDTRSIKEIHPDDLSAYTQCHFFAGGGFWSVAARLAGWPDDRELWTGSCPCQPFSAAGKGLGTDDPRHLWPDFFRLIRARRPAVVMGEQVAGKAGYGWFDGVRLDLAGEDYACRAVDFPACSVDAPHQRNRLYWITTDGRVADGDSTRQAPDGRDFGKVGSVSQEECRAEHHTALSGRSDDPTVRHVPGAEAGVTQGDAFSEGLEGQRGDGDGIWRSEPGGSIASANGAECSLHADTTGKSPSSRHAGKVEGQPVHEREAFQSQRRDGGPSLFTNADGVEGREQYQQRGGQGPWSREQSPRGVGRNGTYWSDAEWIDCHDGKARRAQSGIRFLVNGLPGRVDLWRVGGNAIVPEAAAEVIAAFMDVYGVPARRAA